MAQTEASPADSSGKGHYRVTLALFALVVAALVVWFQRHIEPFVTETLIIGGTISLWGLWKLAWSIFTDAGGDDGKDITRRFLGSAGARSALYFAALITALLHLFTSSIYLRFANAAPGEASFKVQVLEGDTVVMGPYTLAPGEVEGHPIFPSARSRSLVYQITEPRGFEPLHKTLSIWGTHDVKVPGSFRRKVYRAVVLAPDTALWSELPKPGDATTSGYYLRTRFNERTATLEEYTLRLVVTGAALDDLQGSAAIKDDARIRKEIEDFYSGAHIDDPAGKVSRLYNADVARLPSPDLTAGAKLTVEVGSWEKDGIQRHESKEFTCEFTVNADIPLQRLIIGPTQKENCK